MDWRYSTGLRSYLGASGFSASGISSSLNESEKDLSSSASGAGCSEGITGLSCSGSTTFLTGDFL